MHKVELHPAFWWTCDSCGRENYGRAVRPSNAGTDDGEWLLAPTHVTCEACGTVFETEESEGERV